MSYSMDPKQNRENSETPSPVSMENQLVYKFASLEATLSNSLRRLDEKMDRMQSDLHDRHIETTSAINHLSSSVEARFQLKRQRIDNIEKDIQRVRDEAHKVADEKAREVKTATEIRLEELHDKQRAIETWQTKMVERMSIIGAGILIVWAVFGNAIQRFFGGL